MVGGRTVISRKGGLLAKLLGRPWPSEEDVVTAVLDAILATTHRHIPNEDLQISDVPPPDASLGQMIIFCHTFNAYKIWGSIEKCWDIEKAGGPDTLDKVRTELWMWYRSICHEGAADDQDIQHMHSILDRIRSLLRT